MAKAGMKRPEYNKTNAKAKEKNSVEPVPEIQGKAKQSGEKAAPIEYKK